MQRQELSNGIWYIKIEAGATPPAWHSTTLEGASQGVAQNVITSAFLTDVVPKSFIQMTLL